MQSKLLEKYISTKIFSRYLNKSPLVNHFYQLSVQKKGPMEGAPSRAELEAYIRMNDR